MPLQPGLCNIYGTYGRAFIQMKRLHAVSKNVIDGQPEAADEEQSTAVQNTRNKAASIRQSG
jgi:hypothetical protein